jgi:hypothetical protein
MNASMQGYRPKSLGHLTEGKDARVFGFVVEWVPDAKIAGPGDPESCMQEAFGRLHEFGTKPGDIKKHPFLVWEGRGVV